MDNENIHPSVNSDPNPPLSSDSILSESIKGMRTQDTDAPSTIDLEDSSNAVHSNEYGKSGNLTHLSTAWAENDESPDRLLNKKKVTRRKFQSPSLTERSTKQLAANEMWSQALQGIKEEQMGRSAIQRNSIEQQRQQLDESKVAKKRIAQWKEYSIQTALSAEETGLMWREIKAIIRDMRCLYDIDRRLPQNQLRGCESFILGETKIYAAANISPELNMYLHNVCDAREKYVPLNCGVKKNVRVIALAAKAANEQFYLAIHIKPTTTAQNRKLIGATSVAFYSEDQNKLTEVNFFLHNNREEADLTALRYHKGDFNSVENTYDEEDQDEPEADSSPLPSYHHEEAPVTLMLQTPVEKNSYRVDEDVEHVINQIYYTSDDSESEQVQIVKQESYHSSPMPIAPMEEAFAVAPSHAVPSATPLNIVTSTWCVNEEDKSGPDSAASFVNYRSTSEVIVPLDVMQTKETNSSDRLFVCATGSESILIDQNLKYSRSASKCVVEHNRAYEWIEGIYLEGWLYKWPSKYNGFGTPQRRFFILKDNLLCYYESKPQHREDYQRVKIFNISEDTQVETVANMFQHCLKISSANGGEFLFLKMKEGSRKERVWMQALNQSIRLQGAKRLSLMTTVKTLWHHDFNRAGQCEIVSVDATMLRDVFVKTAIFACSSDSTGKVFDIDDEDDDKGSVGDAGHGGYGRKAEEWNHLAHPRNFYTVDIVTNEVEKLQLEVLMTNEMPFQESNLRCVKIYGDKLLLGGSGGFVGIGMVGKSTELSLSMNSLNERHRRVLYVVKCRGNFSTTVASGDDSQSMRSNSTANSFNPHSPLSEIQFFAYTDQSDIFVAADNERMLSFWHLTKEHSAEELVMSPSSRRKPGFYYSCKPELQSAFSLASLDYEEESGQGCFYADEQITALHFLPENSYLIVSTTMRLLLLEVTYASSRCNTSRSFKDREHKFGVVGYVQLDSVQQKQQKGLFALNVVDPAQSTVPVRSPASLASLSDASSGSAYNLQSLHQNGTQKVQSAPKLKQMEKRLSHKSLSLLERRIVHWRFIARAEGDIAGEGCNASRHEWTEQQFNAYIHKIRPVSA